MDGDNWFVGPINGLTFLGEQWLVRLDPSADDPPVLH